MESKTEKIDSKFVQKTLIASGRDFGFFHVDFTVGEKMIRNYETLEPLKFSKLGFETCTFIPILEKSDNVSKKQWILLIYAYSGPLERFVVRFPCFETKDSDFLGSLTEKFREITGISMKSYELLEDLDKIPNIYADPACCNKRSKAIKVKILLNEEEFGKLENDKKLNLVEIDGDLCEKLRTIAKEREAILSDKAWYWALGRNLNKSIGIF